MKKLKLSQVFAFLIVIFSSGSAFSYFCPGGNGFIDEGDTQATVRTACGAPTTIQNITTQGPEFETAQYWVYNNNIAPINSRQPSLQAIGFTPTQTVIEIVDDKARQITVNGSSVSSTDQCAIGSTVREGDSVAKLMKNCGPPEASNTTQRHVEDNQNQQVQVWTYNYGPNSPQLVLEFDITGQLLSIQEGQAGY